MLLSISLTSLRFLIYIRVIGRSIYVHNKLFAVNGLLTPVYVTDWRALSTAVWWRVNVFNRVVVLEYFLNDTIRIFCMLYQASPVDVSFGNLFQVLKSVFYALSSNMRVSLKLWTYW